MKWHPVVALYLKNKTTVGTYIHTMSTNLTTRETATKRLGEEHTTKKKRRAYRKTSCIYRKNKGCQERSIRSGSFGIPLRRASSSSSSSLSRRRPANLPAPSPFVDVAADGTPAAAASPVAASLSASGIPQAAQAKASAGFRSVHTRHTRPLLDETPTAPWL